MFGRLKSLFVILNASEELSLEQREKSYAINKSPLYLSRVYIARRRFFALLRMTKRISRTHMVRTPTRAGNNTGKVAKKSILPFLF
jgi:hypothetical protein